LTATDTSTSRAGVRPAGGRRPRLSWLGLLPFLGYVGLFLLLPTGIVAAGAFVGPGGPSLDGFAAMGQGFIATSFVDSVVVSAASALAGAAAGSLLAYVVVTGNPRGTLRRVVTSACGVLAQFGGVTLAFAFIATIGGEGFVTVWLRDHGIDIYANGVWLYQLSGLTLVYTYFQVPLMVLVFLPALDGVRPQWREATESLGGNGWHYWRHVAGPLLLPAFLGSTLLLFANAFSAYATAAALINQGGIVVPLQISNALTSEVGLQHAELAKALALGMVVIVAVVMLLYALLQRRTARWVR
jgi:putative spermidine/putrescine transport system permease protein